MFVFHKPSVSLMIAFLIIGFWGGMLTLCLKVDLTQIPLISIGIIIAVQTFLNTGLFITAHDAMHGLVCPVNPQLNHRIGNLAVSLYALFSYAQLRERHLLHHQFPGTDFDPDYHNGKNSSFLSWYGQFMQKYLNWEQLLKLLFLVISIGYLADICYWNLILFWWLPLIFSSLQLFTFGTFFPHRQLQDEQQDFPVIHSLNLAPFWSFLSCYHFSYHWEHHQYPHLPWWQLPSVRRYNTR